MPITPLENPIDPPCPCNGIDSTFYADGPDRDAVLAACAKHDVFGEHITPFVFIRVTNRSGSTVVTGAGMNLHEANRNAQVKLLAL